MDWIGLYWIGLDWIGWIGRGKYKAPNGHNKIFSVKVAQQYIILNFIISIINQGASGLQTSFSNLALESLLLES